MPRISRDEMFMRIADIVALRGTCDRARVGAVLVSSDNNIEAIGYNGAPAGEPHCDEVGHKMVDGHCVRTIHAEQNCLSKLENDFPTGVGYTMYVTHFPCWHCTNAIVLFNNAKGRIKRIVYKNAYGDPEVIHASKCLLDMDGIEVRRYEL